MIPQYFYELQKIKDAVAEFKIDETVIISDMTKTILWQEHDGLEAFMKESLNTAIEIGNLELLKTILNQIMQISFYLKKDAQKLMQVKTVFQPILKSQDETSVIIDAKQMISDRLKEL